jgi:predicted membrane protein
MKIVEQLFTNKFFLYIVAFLTFVTVLGYMNERNYDSVLFLVAIGLVIRNFNKNMALVMIMAVFLTSIYTYVKKNTLESMAGFRSRYKNSTVEEFENNNDDNNDNVDYQKIKDFNKIKDTYNDLINTIKEKSAKIKALTKKIKV